MPPPPRPNSGQEDSGTERGGTWSPGFRERAGGAASLCFRAAASRVEELEPDPGWEAPSSFPLPLIKSEVHSGSPLPLCPTQREAERERGFWCAGSQDLLSFVPDVCARVCARRRRNQNWCLILGGGGRASFLEVDQISMWEGWPGGGGVEGRPANPLCPLSACQPPSQCCWED